MTPNELLGELVSSLHEEGNALAAGDMDRLNAASSRKSELLSRLAPQLRQVGHGDSTLDLVQLRQAAMLNSVNAQLLTTRMLANNARLETLAVGNGQPIYDAGGTTGPQRRSARSLAAA
jgi:flagellar biosynthesis/type III secretory pathway chaperone